MSSSAVELTPKLVGQLWQALRDAGAPVAANARPGLSVVEMDTMAAAAGLELTHECHVWWGTHDGTAETGQRHATTFGPGWAFAPLRLALDLTRDFRDLEAEEPSGPGDPASNSGPFWAPTYLALVNADVTAAADLADPSARRTPVRMIDPGGARFPFHADLGSIGDLVQVWTAALTTREWRYDQAADQWLRTGTDAADVPYGAW